MQSNKLDKNKSKYYNTACLMDEALILLLEKKEYSFITVKDICEKAGVHRSTFYLHYETIDDLLSECIEYIGGKVLDKFDNKLIDIQALRTCKVEDLVFVTPKYLTPYLEFVKENKTVYRVAYTQPNVLKENVIINHLYLNIFEPILDRFNIPKREQRYIINFYLSGIGAVMIDWIKNNCKEEISTIVNILIKCLNIGNNLCINGKNS